MGYFLKNRTNHERGLRHVISRKGKAHLAAKLYRIKNPAAKGWKRYCRNSGTVYTHPTVTRGARPVFFKRSNGNKGAIIGTATYSGTNTAIPAGQHGIMLCPVAAVSDPNNTYQVDSTNPVLPYVRFGLWDHAFDTASPPNVLNGNSESANFVGSDSRRFYIRIYDPSATTSTVTVDWFTQKPGNVDDDHPSTDTITLTRSSSNPALYASKALMLVSDDVDNAQVTNTGLTGGSNAALGAADHRLRRAALGDTMCYSYAPGGGVNKQTFTVPIFGPPTSPDPVKTMTVQIANLYQGKTFTLPQNSSFISTLKASVAARYAVAGIKVNINYNPGVDNVSIPSSSGIDLNQVEPGDGSSAGDEGKLATIVKTKYSGADSHTIFLILIQQFAWDAGGTPTNYTQNQGEAFSQAMINYDSTLTPSLHCSFVARLGPLGTSSTTCVPPHELGHQLSAQTYPTPNDLINNNHYQSSVLQAYDNLMSASAADPSPGNVVDSRRLWDDSTHPFLSHPLQIDFMRQSPLLQ